MQPYLEKIEDYLEITTILNAMHPRGVAVSRTFGLALSV
jgi:hypothetical protein